jgi:hypothetical protein
MQQHSPQQPTTPPRRPRTRQSDAATQKLPPNHDQQGRQQPPPSSNTTSARPLGNGAVEWHAFGQVVYVKDATKHPPGASYAVAGLVGICCLVCVVWQMITTYSAFSNIIFDGTVWAHLSRAGEDAARLPIEIICGLIAVGFQSPLIIWAFKVDKRFASERHRRLSFASKMGLMWEVTKEVVAANLFLSLWAAIALVADTIGDVAFLSAYTDSSIVLFFYGTSLYGMSTIGLSECLQILWDGMVTSEWLQHVRTANAAAVAAMKRAQQKGAQA